MAQASCGQRRADGAGPTDGLRLVGTNEMPWRKPRALIEGNGFVVGVILTPELDSVILGRQEVRSRCILALVNGMGCLGDPVLAPAQVAEDVGAG